jgi:hypothetical protein
VVNALLLRRLPVTRPEELVRMVLVYPAGFVTWDPSYGLCAALIERKPNFAQVLCQGQADVAWSDWSPLQEESRPSASSSGAGSWR